MGMTNVKLKVKSLTDPKKFYEGDFLVDSGAQFTVLPENVWKDLKLKSSGKQNFSLADGTIISRQIGNALVEFEKVERATPVVLGEKNDNFLLGALTLEALGLVLDPFKRKLYQAHLML